jgi:hypothetical protein
MINWRTIKEQREAVGEKRIALKLVNLINDGKITPDEFSLFGLWEALGRPRLKKQEPIPSGFVSEDDFEITEAMDSSAFPQITGALINKVVTQAYDLAYGAGDQLVESIPSSLREETLVGFGDDSALKEVPEGMDYQEGSITEKYHKIKNRKFGRIIGLTAEMVKFDQTAQMIRRSRRVGEMAKSKKEEIIMNAVLELVSTGEYAAWRPQGTATTLYSNTSTDPFSDSAFDNLGTNALADETDVDEMMQLFAAATDEKGNPITVDPGVLFCGLSLEAVAAKILRSGQAVKLTSPAGVTNIYSGRIVPISSVWVDQKLGTAYWLLGDFKKQFVYTEVFPLQVFQAKSGSTAEFERDVVYRFKARFMGGCGAVSNRYVAMSTGAS